jgi:putative acetyltransferase
MICYTSNRLRHLNLDQIRQLFYDTITIVNATDYNTDQISVWSASWSDADRWKSKIDTQFFLVACIAAKVVGFGSLTDEGYLDFMYVHKDHQGQRIATALLAQLENKS